MNISDLVPSAELLLGLEVEDLAAVLLEVMNRRRRSAEPHFHTNEQFEFMRWSHDEQWPQHRYRAVNDAVAEAAAWLEREVLIIRDPAERIAPGGPYVVTRRGMRLRNCQSASNRDP